MNDMKTKLFVKNQNRIILVCACVCVYVQMCVQVPLCVFKCLHVV